MFERLISWLNDLNPRQLLILAGVVVLLMFGTVYFFLSWWIAGKDDEKKIEEPVEVAVVEKRNVVVAKKDIPPLTMIKAEMLETKEVAEELIPQGAVTEVSEILNVTAKTEIFAGDVVTMRKLLDDSKQLTFVGTIPADCRAVSISVNEITGVDGFAKPGDKVDLLLVETYEKRSATASLLLQDVLLLSINKNMGRQNENSSAEEKNSGEVVPSTATFALRPDDVLKLVSASKLGEIYLSLRPAHPVARYSDTVDYTIDSINADKFKKENAPQTAPVPPIPETPQKEEAVTDENKFEIIQGDQIVQKK
ncbi:MAG: Flp pilus assembly protein CpaB [Selenomonadaceae bacterium]|nr:Flp pilus assembly protein CpaB [Selenomonadaceae bacterium]